MIGRLVIGLGTFIFGYYVGREVGRTEVSKQGKSKTDERIGRTITVEPVEEPARQAKQA